MSDEKDRFGDKLRNVEAARGQWAARQDAELMKRIRAKLNTTIQCPIASEIVPHRLGDLSLWPVRMATAPG